MLSYLYRKLTQHRGSPRFWLEGKQPLRSGFSAGRRYTVQVDRDKKMVTLSVADNGTRLVSGKERGGNTVPVIDINSREVLDVFDGIDVVRVIVREGRIHILPGVTEMKRRERLARLEAKLAANEPLAVGSISHGIGVLSHALHAGLKEGGVESRMAFANDIREELLDQSFDANSTWDAGTSMLSAPMQEFAADRWALGQLPQIDICEGGLPCSGASVAGRAKRGTNCAEAHPEVGALVVPFIQFLQATNPALVVFENVVPYQSSASMWILRHALRDMAYETHEIELDAEQFNELEHRKRICMVAVTRGMSFDFADLERPPLKVRELGEVLERFAEDDPCWSGFDYLKRHQEKHAALGNGFQMQIFTPASTHIGTITKGYAKIRSTDPKIAHPSNPELMRQVTPSEHAACKGIPPGLVKGMSKTGAHEGLGQSICYAPFKAVGKLLAKTIRTPVDRAVAAVISDLLAA